MSELFDAPNQQVVRPDGSPPWQEGEGGSTGFEPGPAAPSTPPTTAELDAMTKDQLLAYAQSLGVSPANAGMTKEELRAGVDAKLAGG